MALMCVVKVNNVTLVRFLIECGTDVMLTNKEGKTAADIAQSVSQLPHEAIRPLFIRTRTGPDQT